MEGGGLSQVQGNDLRDVLNIRHASFNETRQQISWSLSIVDNFVINWSRQAWEQDSMKGTLTQIQRSDKNERKQPRRWEEGDVCFLNVRQMRGGCAGPGGQAGTLK